MSSHAITIGSISLHDFEVPTSIHFGGRQRLVVHRTADGTRIVEPLGPDDGEIRFSGIFSGANAETRARALDNLRLSAAAVWLTWQSFRYKIIVGDFAATYNSRWWIPYRLSCVIVHQAGVRPSVLLSTRALILGALASAQSALAGIDVDMSPLSSALLNSGSLTPGSTANSQATVTANQSLSALQSRVDLQSQSLLSLSQGSGAAPDTSAFGAQVGCSGMLANTVGASSYIGLICSNLGSLGA